MLLTGRNPFPGVGKAQVKHLIVTKELDYTKPYFKEISEEAVNFIQCALIRNIDERYSAAQMLKHPWFELMSKQIDFGVDAEQHKDIIGNMVPFSKANKF